MIYADPPYLGSTRSSIAGGRRPDGDYAHEFHTDAQHVALAEALRRAQTAVFVSGYHSPLYDELYAGWDRTERRVLRRVGNGRSSSNSHAVEVIWSNRPLGDRLQLDAGPMTDRADRSGAPWSPHERRVSLHGAAADGAEGANA